MERSSDQNTLGSSRPSSLSMPDQQQLPSLPMAGGRRYNPALTQLLDQKLRLLWQHQILELRNEAVVRQHPLPLARVKRVMKLDGAVRMISADAPLLVAKACELFLMELTVRAWLHTEAACRRTIHSGDAASAVLHHAEAFDFLRDVIPWDEAMVDVADVGNEAMSYKGTSSTLFNEEYMMSINREISQHPAPQTNAFTPIQLTSESPSLFQMEDCTEDIECALSAKQAGKRPRREWA